MKKISVILTVLSAVFIQAQPLQGLTPIVPDGAIKKIEKEADSIHVTEKMFNDQGKLIMSVRYSDYKGKIKDGEQIMFNGDGSVYWMVEYKNNRRNGRSYGSWKNGKIKREEFYENDVLISGKCFDESGKETPYNPMELHPEFPGGTNALFQFIGKNFKSPNRAKGKIIVSFVVDETGKVVDAKISKSLNDGMDKEAIRVVESLPLWKPAQQDGIPVRCSYQLPIVIN